MIRITMHLSGVKPQMVENKVTDPATGRWEWKGHKMLFNTIAQLVKDESEGIAFMNNHLENNDGVKCTKYYFTNL